MSIEYDKYLVEHKQAVKACLELLSTEPTPVKNLLSKSIEEIILKHDISKYSEDEYQAYDDKFYGKICDNNKFDKAWLHHIHNNPHHWQYWVLIESSQEIKALEMPDIYILEMVADWGSFSYNKKESSEILTWYAEHKDKMILHPNTRKKVENLIIILSNKMSELFNK